MFMGFHGSVNIPYIPYMDAMGYGFDGWQAQPHASSQTKSRGLRSKARAKQSSCRSPLVFNVGVVVIFISFCFPQNHRKISKTLSSQTRSSNKFVKFHELFDGIF